VENDQRTFWENEFRRRARALDEARQALFSARLSTFRGETSGEQMAVHRAQRSLAQAEEKLRHLKVWARDYDNRVQPLVKQMEKLHTVLTQDMSQAVAYLGSALQTLAAYAEKSIPVPPAGAALPAGDAERKPAGDPHTAGGHV
jgi:hypothetical protein